MQVTLTNTDGQQFVAIGTASNCAFAILQNELQTAKVPLMDHLHLQVQLEQVQRSAQVQLQYCGMVMDAIVTL